MKEDIPRLSELAQDTNKGSIYQLGGTAPNRVLAKLRYFENEYGAHIIGKRCLAGVCVALLTFRIDQDKCNGFSVCARNCTSGAMTGEKKRAHMIEQENTSSAENA